MQELYWYIVLAGDYQLVYLEPILNLRTRLKVLSVTVSMNVYDLNLISEIKMNLGILFLIVSTPVTTYQHVKQKRTGSVNDIAG